MDDIVKQLEALGLDPLFAQRTAGEIVSLGATVDDFKAYLAHVHAVNHRLLALKGLRERRLRFIKRLMAWTDFRNLWLELVALLVMSPLVLPLTVGVRLAWWFGSRKVQRQFCPWFREWVARGIDSDSHVAIVRRRDHPTPLPRNRS